jgi:hypothetical protein
MLAVSADRFLRTSLSSKVAPPPGPFGELAGRFEGAHDYQRKGLRLARNAALETAASWSATRSPSSSRSPQSKPPWASRTPTRWHRGRTATSRSAFATPDPWKLSPPIPHKVQNQDHAEAGSNTTTAHATDVQRPAVAEPHRVSRVTDPSACGRRLNGVQHNRWRDRGVVSLPTQMRRPNTS